MKAGKLPFTRENDRIARYGKGFSNLLQMSSVGEPSLQESSQHQDIYDQTMQQTSRQQATGITDDELMEDSVNKAAAYALYQPEVKPISDPLTYMEAKKKYRNQKTSGLDEAQRSLKKRSIARPNHKRFNSIGGNTNMASYLGKTVASQ